MARKKSRKVNKFDRLTAFYEVLSMCGDPEHAAELVNMGMEQAYRALRGPDGFTRLDEMHSADRGTYYAMTPAQLKAFFSQGVACGVLPRVLLDMNTGLPLVDGKGQAVIVYEYVSDTVRMTCAQHLGKMLGAFIDRKQIEVEKPQDPNELSADVKEKVADIYNTSPKHKEEKQKEIDFDPLAI